MRDRGPRRVSTTPARSAAIAQSLPDIRSRETHKHPARTRRAHRSAHGRPLPDGPAPFTTLVELTFEKRRIEHWIRFGQQERNGWDHT
ncbi:hypothetical protein DPM13_17770 [Paracoccus mutanolyticus]|uniref:Uncharacterized protein n=1 Tax=Paracoccus mutanolyticus TaxID=1499308 RepID=A0ABN5M8C9_9RHOB|nr:hypothetical protein DPM13_17770 [Paracoccus mutanolyticus]